MRWIYLLIALLALSVSAVNAEDVDKKVTISIKASIPGLTFKESVAKLMLIKGALGDKAEGVWFEIRGDGKTYSWDSSTDNRGIITDLETTAPYTYKNNLD